MRIWLDDVRPTPAHDPGWTPVTTGEELLAIIANVGLDAIDEISFDNDLGTGCMEGHEVLTRIEELVLTGQVTRVPYLAVHSANPVAARRMHIIIERIMTYATQQSLL